MLDTIAARLTALTALGFSWAFMAWALSSMLPLHPEGLGRLAQPLRSRRTTGKTRKLDDRVRL